MKLSETPRLHLKLYDGHEPPDLVEGAYQIAMMQIDKILVEGTPTDKELKELKKQLEELKQALEQLKQALEQLKDSLSLANPPDIITVGRLASGKITKGGYFHK